MKNAKIQQEQTERRVKDEPEVQKKLRANIEQVLSSKVKSQINHAWWQYGLTYEVEAKDALEVFKTLRDDSRFSFNMLIDVTAVDWLDSREQRFEVIYQLLSITHQHRLCIKISVSEKNPEVDSLRSLWPAANFLEREVWDMYGIKFKGHGDLRRILMYDEFEGHPLRKDYPILKKQPRVPLRIPELHNSSKDMRREQLVAMPSSKRFKSINSYLKEHDGRR